MKEGAKMKKYALGAMLKFSNKLLEKDINEKMQKLNVTRSQMDLLAYVFFKSKEHNEINQVDIERYLNLKNPTVTGLINRLEKKDYIKREVSEKGARYKSIVATEKGVKLLEAGKKILDDLEKNMFSVLSKEEKNELERLLSKIIENKVTK